MITITSGRAKAVLVEIQRSVLNAHRNVKTDKTFRDKRSGFLNVVITHNEVDLTTYRCIGKCKELVKDKRYSFAVDYTKFLSFTISCEQLLNRLPVLKVKDIYSISFFENGILIVVNNNAYVLNSSMKG